MTVRDVHKKGSTIIFVSDFLKFILLLHKFIGIYVVGDLEDQLHVTSVNLLTRKHMLIPIDQHYAAMPLVHNDYGKYL